MAAQPDVLLVCYQAAASAARPALERCIDHAIAELQSLETQSMKLAERDALADSWRYLLVHKTAWCERYAAELLTTFTQRFSSPLALGLGADARKASSGLDAFGLVDDAELRQKIDAQRLLQNLLPDTEQTLAELDALVSSALGLDFVAPDRNPLRPEIFTRTLQQLMGGNLEDAAATVLALHHIAKPLGRELNLIYKQAIKALDQANIPAAGYQYRVQPSVPKGIKPQALGVRLDGLNNGFEGAAAVASRPQALADLSNVGVKAGLLNDFLSNDCAQGEQGLDAHYYDSIEEELVAIKAASDQAASDRLNSDRLNSDGSQASSMAAPLSSTAQATLARLPAVDRPRRAVNASSLLSEQVWGPYGTSRARSLVRTQLKKEATKVSQVLGLDVVRELVNQVAQDPRLLGPVREAIVALEPSLLRLAMVDPRFFSDERHAGRQLMERAAQRSFKYNDEFSPEFIEFYQALSQSFNQLNARTIDDAQPFSSALAALTQTWNAQDQVDFDKRQQVLKALRFAEERQEKADEIAFDLSTRSDLDKVPGVVLDFLFGPWALAMANARLLDTRNQVDPEGLGSVVPNLVWSVKSDVTLKQPAKLIDMIPGMLEKLHSGLGLLGQDPRENEAFFESLMKLHRPVLKLRRLKSQRDAEESNHAPLAPEEDSFSPAERLEKLRAQSAGPLWMGRDDLDAAGFEDTQPTEHAELDEYAGLGEHAEPDDHAEPDHAAMAAAPQLAMASGLHDDEDDPSSDAKPVGCAPGAAWAKPVVLAEVGSLMPTLHQSEQAKAQAALTLSRLKTGNWVDLYSKRQWLRAQLIWASSHATLFMFVSHGGRPHSMTKRSCEKLIAQRLLRPVDTQGVVAQALDAVAESAAAQSRAVNAQPAQSAAAALTASTATTASKPSQLEMA